MYMPQYKNMLLVWYKKGCMRWNVYL